MQYILYNISEFRHVNNNIHLGREDCTQFASMWPKRVHKTTTETRKRKHSTLAPKEQPDWFSVWLYIDLFVSRQYIERECNSRCIHRMDMLFRYCCCAARSASVSACWFMVVAQQVGAALTPIASSQRKSRNMYKRHTDTTTTSADAIRILELFILVFIYF